MTSSAFSEDWRAIQARSLLALLECLVGAGIGPGDVTDPSTNVMAVVQARTR